MQILVLASIIMAIGGVVFALQNQMTVSVSFLLWTIDSSLALVLLVALALGAIAVFLSSMPERFRTRKSLARQRKELESCRAARHDLEVKVKELEKRIAATQLPISSYPAEGGSAHRPPLTGR